MTNKDINTELFIDNITTPEDWVQKGVDLFDCALVFEPMVAEFWKSSKSSRNSNRKFYQCYMMLASFAVENLIKALIILQNKENLKENVENQAKLPKLLNGHNLSLLCQRASIKVKDKDAKEFLQRMSDYAIWEARYSTPSHPDQMIVVHLNKTSAPIVLNSIFARSDIENVHNLFKTIKNIYNKRINTIN